MGGEMINIIPGVHDERCNALVMNPINYLSKKWGIPFVVGGDSSNYKINVHYRHVSGPKPTNGSFHGIFIDDLPSVYSPSLQDYISSYHFYVVANRRMGDFLCKNYGDKPVVFFEALSGKEYYRDLGCLSPKRWRKKKIAMFMSSAYDFPIKDYAHKKWETIYFTKEKRPYKSKLITPHPLVIGVEKFIKKVSKISPDILVQGWLPSEPNFFFKANLKMRNAIALNSCLVAQDLGNIYNINNGVNGFMFNSIEGYHKLLDNIHINVFRQIGASLVDNDREILKKFYLDLISLEDKLKWSNHFVSII